MASVRKAIWYVDIQRNAVNRHSIVIPIGQEVIILHEFIFVMHIVLS